MSAVVTVAGMVAVALPVRLVLDAGFLSLLAIVAAGVIGAVAGLALGDRVMLAEIRDGAEAAIAKVRR